MKDRLNFDEYFYQFQSEGEYQDDLPYRDTTEQRVLIFKPVFEDSLVDDFWKEYKIWNLTSKVSFNSIIQADNDVQRKYLFLLKSMVGDSFEFPVMSRYLTTNIGTSKKKAHILYKAKSLKAGGFFAVDFNVNDDRRITLDKITFFPFDYSSNLTLANISEQHITALNNGDLTATIDTMMRYAGDIGFAPAKKAAKEIKRSKITAGKLFSYRLLMDKTDIWAILYYDTSQPEKRLMMAYKLYNKQFKPAFMELLSKRH